MTTEATVGELVKAVNAVMADVGYVKATGRNTQQNYNYTSDEDLLKAIQPAMAAHGLALIPAAISEVETDAAYQTKTGGTMWRRAAIVTYNLAHTSGAVMPVTVYAEGCDTADKGAVKLMTAAYKYALRQAFAIPTGDDAERDVKVGAEPGSAVNGYAKANGKPKATGAPEDVAAVLTMLDDAATTEDFESAKAFAKAAWKRMTDAEQATVTAAVKATEATLASMVPA